MNAAVVSGAAALAGLLLAGGGAGIAQDGVGGGDAARAAELLESGDYPGAGPVLERLVERWREAVRDGDPEGGAVVGLARALLSLGMVKDELEDPGGAVLLLEEAEELLGETGGAYDVLLGDCADALGKAYQHSFRYGEAEAAFGRAIELRENAAEPGWADVSRDHLGLLYLAAGRYREAGAEFAGTLASTPARELALLAQRHGYLGRYHHTLRNYGRAADHWREALRAGESAWGRQARDLVPLRAGEALTQLRAGALEEARRGFVAALGVARGEEGLAAEVPVLLGNLGEVALLAGDAAGARVWFTEAYELMADRLGEEHPAVAVALNNLACAAMEEGDFGAAGPWFERAYRAAASVVEPLHQLPVRVQQNRATNALRAGDRVAAAEATGQFVADGEELLHQVVAFGSERQRLNFRAGVDLMSLPCSLGDDAGLIADLSIRTKGMVQASLIGGGTRADGAGLGGVGGWEAVRDALPGSAVFVDFVSYRPVDVGDAGEHLGAVVIAATSTEPRWVEIGRSADVERLLMALDSHVRAAAGGAVPPPVTMRSVLRRLHDAVWQPVAATWNGGGGEVDTVCLSPDGAIHFVPWAALLGPDGRYVGEDVPQLVAVASGRDLVDPGVVSRPLSGEGAWVCFAVDDEFGGGERSADGRGGGSVGRDGTGVFPAGLLEQCREMRPLRSAGVEARAVAGVSPSRSDRLLEGGRASEGELRAMGVEIRPEVLHFATHAFFVAEDDGGAVRAGLIDYDAEPEVFYQSGFVLHGFGRTADAAARGSDGELPPPLVDGFVFAQEVAGLDLRDTSLVTVSACQSGAGAAAAGEGLIGLARGFAQAGVRDVLLALWPVFDHSSPGLMEAFYRTAVSSGNPPGALWALQRSELGRVGERDEDGALREAVLRVAGYTMTHRGALAPPVGREHVAAVSRAEVPAARGSARWALAWMGAGCVLGGLACLAHRRRSRV